jgi:hypothetical protein
MEASAEVAVATPPVVVVAAIVAVLAEPVTRAAEAAVPSSTQLQI